MFIIKYRFQQDYHFIYRYSINLCRGPGILVKLFNYLTRLTPDIFGKNLAMLTCKHSYDFQNSYVIIMLH